MKLFDIEEDGPTHKIPCMDCKAEVEVTHAVWEYSKLAGGAISHSQTINRCSAQNWEQCDSECFSRQRQRYTDPFSEDRRCLGPPLRKDEVVRCGDCTLAFNEMHNRRLSTEMKEAKQPQSKEERAYKSLLDEIGDG